MLKAELRREIRRRKQLYSSEELARMSQDIVARLLSNEHIVSAKTVMMYCSLADEVDTREAIDTLLSKGKQVVLPVVVGENDMILRQYTGRDSLKQGAFGIEEPQGEPFNRLQDIDIVVVPGMAFDAHGNRLGRGKGYYDCFLTALPRAYKLGVCFDFQKQDVIPTDENDIRMDEIL